MSLNKDLSYAFTLSRQCLRIFGVWPDPHIPLNEFRRPNLRYMLAMCLLIFYVFIPQITNIFRIRGNMMLMVECIASVNYSSLAFYKLIVTRYHGENMSDLKALRTLMTSIKTDWVTSRKKWEQNTMLKVARTGRSLCFRCYVSLACTTVVFIVFNILKLYRNVHQSQRKLVYQFNYPYDIQKTPVYVITYFTQMSAALYGATINSTVDTFIALLLLHICAQLINLRITLNEWVENLTEKSILSTDFKKGLSAIVLRHEDLIRNAKTIDDCYSTVLLMHIVVATFQLCFESFQVYTIITDNNGSVSLLKMFFVALYANLLLLHLYMYCYSAEKLITESTGIAYSVYECRWYDLPTKYAKDLMLIVYRSMIPLRLTAGKFNTFSIEMFGTLVKTSMGYLSMLLTIKD